MHARGSNHKVDSKEIIKKEYELLLQEINSGYSLNEVIYNEHQEAVNFRIVRANKAFAEQAGVSPQNIKGKTILDLFPKIDQEIIAKVCSVEKNNGLIMLEFLSKDTEQYYNIKAYGIGKGIFACVLKNTTANKLTEIELRKSQKFTQKVLDTAPNMIYIFDLEENRLIYVNQAVGAIIGYSSQELIEIGDRLLPLLLHPDDVKTLNAHHNKIKEAKDGDILEVKYRYKHKKGEYRVLKSYETNFLRDNSNQVKQVVGNAIDVTEELQNTRELSDTKSLLEAVIMQSPVAMALASSQNNDARYINEACCMLLGLNPEISGSYVTINKIVDLWEEYNSEGKKIPTNELPLYRAMKGDIICNDERTIKRRDGTTNHINLNGFPIYNESGELMAGAVIALDTSKQKHVEELIRESEKRFRTMIEFNSIPMAISDLNQDIVLLNKKFTETYGYTLKDIPTSEKWWKSAYPDTGYRKKVQQEWDSAAEKAMQEKSSVPKQTWNIVCKDGSKKTVEFTFVNLGDLNILSMNDITELKTKEEELKAAKEKAEESDHLKSAFLANMSHEIRTPMNGLVGFVDLLLQDDISEEKKKFYRNVIQDSCQRLLNIINDILDISKIETKQYSVHLEELNLNDFLLETYSLFLSQAKNKDISINFKNGLIDNNSFIITDSQKLKQILNNLLSNAIKFTHDGSIELGYKLKGDFLEFYVDDTGIGIAAENIDNIFERFIQADLRHERKYGGTGLGLSIAKGFTELLGGTISCESNLDKGSKFTFTLPYKPGKSNVFLNVPFDTRGNKKNIKNILVAEDEEINFLFIEELLKDIDLNIKITHVLNGDEAIHHIKTNNDFKLVLMDIKMPGMNGLEATKIIKKIRPELPVIAQTAYAMAEDERKAREAGCDSYISKPIDREKFTNIIKGFL